MTLEELHTHKDKMEEEIFKAIRDFEQTTGLMVRSIDLSRANFLGVRSQALIDVHARVELESR